MLFSELDSELTQAIAEVMNNPSPENEAKLAEAQKLSPPVDSSTSLHSEDFKRELMETFQRMGRIPLMINTDGSITKAPKLSRHNPRSKGLNPQK